MKIRVILLLVILMVIPTLQAQETETITLITYDSFSVSEDVLAAFEDETGIHVAIHFGGDTGLLVNQAILTKDAPQGDVLYGVDNTFLSRALAADLFIPYESPLLEHVPERFQVDPEFRVTPVDYGDVCLNYDIAYFEDHDLALPESLADLTKADYHGLLVAENPATSSPGLAFLLATIAEFGTEGDYTYLDYWQDLFANDVLVTGGWDSAYFGHFTAASEDGLYPMVVSYASSPPVTVDEASGEPTTASIVADGMCFRQIEFVGILQGTEHEAAAQKLVDFILSVPFQEDIPLQMYVFPVNEEAELPELFAEFAAIPENPAAMTYDAITDAKRREWIEAWDEVALR